MVHNILLNRVESDTLSARSRLPKSFFTPFVQLCLTDGCLYAMMTMLNTAIILWGVFPLRGLGPMRKSARVSLSLVVLVALLLVAMTSCRRAKPSQTPMSVLGEDASAAHAVSAPADAYPMPVTPVPSPTLVLPTATSIPLPTPTLIAPTPTASPVPTVQEEETGAPQSTPVAVSETPSAEGADTAGEIIYTVKWGDSLWALAGRFDTTIANIARLNGLANTDFIRVGQVLIIQTVVSSEPVTHRTYVIRPGDCLSVIAQRYGTSVEELRRVNQIVNPWFIYVGQTLKIPSEASQGELSGTRYVVRAGDTLWHVAIRYGTTVWRIRIMNNIRNPNLIYPGQVLIVP